MTAPLILNDLRARHVGREVTLIDDDGCEYRGVDRCSGCNLFWPCDTARLLALLTPERIALALNQNDPTSLDEKDEWWTTPRNLATDLLAALLAETTEVPQ